MDKKLRKEKLNKMAIVMASNIPNVINLDSGSKARESSLLRAACCVMLAQIGFMVYNNDSRRKQ